MRPLDYTLWTLLALLVLFSSSEMRIKYFSHINSSKNTGFELTLENSSNSTNFMVWTFDVSLALYAHYDFAASKFVRGPNHSQHIIGSLLELCRHWTLRGPFHRGLTKQQRCIRQHCGAFSSLTNLQMWLLRNN